ncbi:MAG: hypothetical protein HZA94_02235 [Candidatus Vogelbacteria bacterium]|nr:hypothetical protein [Candidatus Vogelbacteria bacterium]
MDLIVYRSMSTERKEEFGGMKVEKETGVAADYINAWMMTLYLVREIEKASDETERADALDLAFVSLKPVERYRDYYEKRDYSNKGVVLNGSDVAKIEAIDKLVDEFNSAIPEIRSTRNYARLKDFATRINLLVRGTKDF